MTSNLMPKFSQKYARKITNAKSRKIEFSLTLPQFINLMSQTHCYYSGKKFTKTGNFEISLERLDNSKGYIPGNVVPVARAINSVRSDLSLDQIKNLIEDKIPSEIEKYTKLEQEMNELIELKLQKLKDQKIPLYKVDEFLKLLEYNKEIKSLVKKKDRAKQSLSCKNAKSQTKKLRLIEIKDYDTKINQCNQAIGKLKYTKVERTIKVTKNHPSLKGYLLNLKNIQTPLNDLNKKLEFLNMAYQGLLKHSKLSKFNRRKLKLGLPLSANLSDVIKHELAQKSEIHKGS